VSPDVVSVEIDHGSTSARNRPAGQTWLIRLRRANHAVIVNTGLSRTSAEQLARQIDRLLQPEPADPESTIH
jgi:predicted mannosyl-3-phosphoglycerate phosphatase (HAD superfamily)